MSNVLQTMIICVGLTALGGPVGAAAMPTRSGEVLVEASRMTTGLEQRSVSYRDLELTNPSAQRELIRRVSFAVDSLCNGGDMGITDPINSSKCSRSAWESVRPRIAELLVR